MQLAHRPAEHHAWITCLTVQCVWCARLAWYEPWLPSHRVVALLVAWDVSCGWLVLTGACQGHYSLLMF
ncbi:unnamed protein product [Vitrella brassicaformis CCMP3155]|uniref:Uncharacterized protein n=1 Tax=Vitrella brassicaformis (strain CCMP3155) TaxID=1169540 RepID=A0A0G4FLV8_VITBC|nr:unnamed protein product [Vitrella brassicaformis CCMP3155]|eukprot:CEM14769.1 unnamed protein product [Vitrella brassicaformis CCMP3155]